MIGAFGVYTNDKLAATLYLLLREKVLGEYAEELSRRIYGCQR